MIHFYLAKKSVKTFVTSCFILIASSLYAQSISSFTPASGSVGTLITVNGSGLGSTTNTLTVGGVTAIIITRVSDKIVGMVMPGAVTGVVSVIGNSTATSVSNFTVVPARIPSLQQGEKLQIAGATANTSAWLGVSIAIAADGNTAIVGAYTENSNGGAAYVYVRSGSVWTQQARLEGTGASTGAQQGASVAISADGNTAIVGGPSDSDIGSAWIFVRSGPTWSQQGAKLQAASPAGGSAQGTSVALSADGNTALVGAPYDGYYVDFSFTGAVYVYNRSGSTWTPTIKLVGTGGVGRDKFQGGSAAISADGKTILSGGRLDNSGAGAAWVFTLSGGVWSQQGNKLTGTGAIGAGTIGTSVALSADGNTAIAGGETDNGNTGAAWIFIRSGITWSQQGSKLVGTGFYSGNKQGHSVSLSADGNFAMAGGYYQSMITNGGAWVYVRKAGNWSQPVNKLEGSDIVYPAVAGASVSLSADGNTGIFGGPFEFKGGAAWVFVGCTDPAPTASAGVALAAVCPGTATPALGGSFGGSATSAVWSDNGAGGLFTNNGGATPGTATYTSSVDFTGIVQLQLTTVGGNCANAIALKTLLVSSGVTSTWLGVTSIWNTATNWSTGSVPNSCTKAVVNAGVPNMPTVSGIGNICLSLRLNNGAQLNMAPNAKLTVLKE